MFHVNCCSIHITAAQTVGLSHCASTFCQELTVEVGGRLCISDTAVLCAAGQRDAAEKRLKSLERLLIRADPASTPHQVTTSATSPSPHTTSVLPRLMHLHIYYDQHCADVQLLPPSRR